MDTFKQLKLKDYLLHMIVGTAFILLGIGIGQAIILEVFREYAPASLIAYICGGIASFGIILYGICEIYKAFHYEKRILKSLTPEKREQFLKELSQDVEMNIPGQAVLTKHFLFVRVNDEHYVRVFEKEHLIGCFQTSAHQEAEATEGELVIYDMEFKPANVNISGKGSTQIISELYREICESLPWIYHEDYDDFLAHIRRSGYRKKLVRQMEDLKMRFETGYNSEAEAESEIEALSKDVREQLNPDSLFKRFLKKSK